MDQPFLVRKPRHGGWVAVRSLVFAVCRVALLSILAILSASGQSRSAGAEPLVEPAIPGILGAFDRYDLVGMPADANDFQFALSCLFGRQPAKRQSHRRKSRCCSEEISTRDQIFIHGPRLTRASRPGSTADQALS